jgi:hypothetical protein
MLHFLVEYRRSPGIARWEKFEDRSQALLRRSELERQHEENPDMEVVVLSAPSLDALKRTHSRYFKTEKELVADLGAAST